MKKLICVLACISLLFCFTACGGAKLPEGITEDEVKDAAKNTVDLLNARDYAALAKTFNGEMTSALTETDLASAWEPFYENSGEFDSITKTSVTSRNGYAVAVVVAKYKSKNITFTLSYDTDMKLGGLFFK